MTQAYSYSSLFKLLDKPIVGLLAAILVVVGLVSEVKAESATGSDLLPKQFYYTAVPDLRRCAAPFCGGAWIKKVNMKTTRCPDGSIAELCYVSSVNFPAAKAINVVDGKTLLRGEFSPTSFPGPIFKMKGNTLFEFDVEHAYQPVLKSEDDRGFYGLLTNTGIVCITEPCPTLRFSRLNSRRSAQISTLRFDDSLTDEQRDQIAKDAFDEGALVFGRLTSPKQVRFGYFDLMVKNAFVPVPKKPDDVACGGMLGKSCSRGEYCFYEPKLSCGAADHMGVCRKQPQACIDLYDPVCGCDGVTYSNDCYAAASGTSVVYSGPCGENP